MAVAKGRSETAKCQERDDQPISADSRATLIYVSRQIGKCDVWNQVAAFDQKRLNLLSY
jgi:hypothetical protein